MDNSFQLTVDSGQLTVIGETHVVHFDPSVKVCAERRKKLTMNNEQLTIIGATNVVHLYPSVKVCRERPMCRSAAWQI